MYTALLIATLYLILLRLYNNCLQAYSVLHILSILSGAKVQNFTYEIRHQDTST